MQRSVPKLDEQYLFTLYIPVHNNESHLAKCLGSLMDQDLSAAEVLIIDDASTDSSAHVVEQHLPGLRLQTSVRFLRLVNNEGLPSIIERAMTESRAGILMRLDADDWLRPGAVNALYSRLTADDTVGMVYGNYSEYYESDGTQRDVKLKEGFPARMADAFCHGAGMMFKKKCLIETGGYDSSFKRDDGLQIQLKISSKYDVAHIDRMIFTYRQHRAQKTHDKCSRNAERLRLLEHLASNRPMSNHLVLGFTNQSGGDCRSRDIIEKLAVRICNSRTATERVIYANISSRQATDLEKKYPSVHFKGRASYADLDIYGLAGSEVDGRLAENDVVSMVTDDYPNDQVGYLDLSYFYLRFGGVELLQSGRLFSNLVYTCDDICGVQLRGLDLEKNKREPVFLRCGGVTTCLNSALRSGRFDVSAFMSRSAFFEIDEISSVQTLLPDD